MAQPQPSSEAAGIRGEIGPPPIITILFGAPTIDHPTTTAVPADTMLWTSWTLNSTMTIDGVQSDIEALPSSWGSNLMIAVYVDGKLAGNSTYVIAPNYGGLDTAIIDAPENNAIPGGIMGNAAQPAGAGNLDGNPLQCIGPPTLEQRFGPHLRGHATSWLWVPCSARLLRPRRFPIRLWRYGRSMKHSGEPQW